MVDLLNGKAGPLAGWIVAISNGKTLVGRLQESTTLGALDGSPGLQSNSFELSPVYSLDAGFSREGRVCIALPLLGFGSISSIHVPRGSIVIRVDSLSRDERRALQSAVEQAEGIRSKIRAEESGIAIVGPIR